MSAIVIVLPILPVEQAAEPPAAESSSLMSACRTIGWSGCLAYASGRDHLGCPRVARQLKPGPPERFFFATIKNVVEQGLHAASAGADALCADASADDRTPSLAIDSGRAKSGR